MAYNLDTKVGELMNDTHAMEVLERYMPGLATNPMIGMAAGMSIRSLLAMPQAKQYGVTEEQVMKVLEEINSRT